MGAPELRSGIEYGFLDSSIAAEEHYKPALLVNDYEQGEKVLTTISSELKTCDEFMFSVAFVTEGGVEVLLMELKDLQKRGIKGRIIASQYQNFTQPKALRKLLAFDNVELRIVTDDKSMHTKGYIFRHGEEYTSIIGSSNLTQSALCENKEWNIKVISTKDGGITKDAISEFDKLFSIATPVDDDFLNSYTLIYNQEQKWAKDSYAAYKEANLIELNQERISPNKMQIAAMQNLAALRENGESKALLISATGTGKTYLAAFDVNAYNPKKFLFIIHREQIARKAMESFKRVIGYGKNMAVLSGNEKDYDADFIFATIQTLSRDNVLNTFKPDQFEYIVVDEAHRSGAETYQKVLNYFKPKFLLGMTASPERLDGYDIYTLFDHNIAYEIRLQDAMQEKLICPFHYFGIQDIEVDGVSLDENANFNDLTSDERVKHILEESEFYGYSGERVKGLVFCNKNEVCKELSDKFNVLGYRSVALSGDNSQEERLEAVNRLSQDEYDGGLDYIFTVDIFNEGVDIPAINQVIMLRPTSSAIIFVQQLGRGLRHYIDKDYLVVIDFIANYQKNFLIPIALSGDRTYNKDTVRHYVAEGNSVIPGCSTVSFDQVVSKRIYESIDAAKFNDIDLIKESYKNLKYKIGKIPSLMDFETYAEIDPVRIFESVGSYHEFLKKYEDSYNIEFTEIQEEMLKFISVKFANGKRPNELVMLQQIVSNANSKSLLSETEKELKGNYEIVLDEHARINLINVMTNQFPTGSGKNTYCNSIFVKPFKGEYTITTVFSDALINEDFKDQVLNLIELGLYKNQKYFGNRYLDTTLQLYSKYTYDDVCRLLNWEKSEVPLNIGGYKFDGTTKTYPVFINYNKSEDISATIKYEDHFISQTVLRAISKSKRTVTSDDVQNFLKAEERGITLHLFVRKNKDDKISKEFYYLGTMHSTGYAEEFIMDGTDLTAVELEHKLDVPVRKDLYEYLTN